MIIAVRFAAFLAGPDDAARATPQAVRVSGARRFAVPKGSSLTATTLTQVLRDTRPTTGTTRLIVRWDRETGWAHLAIAVPGTEQTRFAGFHRFTGGTTDAVAAELAAAGCVSAPPLHIDDTLSEIEAVLAHREVTPDAAR